MKSRVSGAILAGGAGSRFNYKTKSNIIIGGRTIISRICRILEDIFEEIIIVTNSPEEFQEYRKYLVIGDQFRKAGPLGGIHAALKTCQGDAVFVFAGDMPLLDKDLIIRQLEYYSQADCNILIPGIGKCIEPLHAIYNRKIAGNLGEYLTNNNDLAVRSFVFSQYFTLMQIDDTIYNRMIFTNINSPSDVEDVEKMLGYR
jgi:molybdenum cofactor guanylyltransferase